MKRENREFIAVGSISFADQWDLYGGLELSTILKLN